MSTPSFHILSQAGIRPTRQRIALFDLMRGQARSYLTAEQMFRDAAQAGLRLSVGTVYNTLNLLARSGLCRRIDATGRIWFTTDPAMQCHLIDEESGEIQEIAPGILGLNGDIPLPEGKELVSLEVLVRVRRNRY